MGTNNINNLHIKMMELIAIVGLALVASTQACDVVEYAKCTLGSLPTGGTGDACKLYADNAKCLLGVGCWPKGVAGIDLKTTTCLNKIKNLKDAKGNACPESTCDSGANLVPSLA